MALGGKAQVQVSVLRRKWKKACRKNASPGQNWARFKRLLGRPGAELVRDLLLLWSHCLGEAAAGEEAGFLEEVLAAAPAEDELVKGWVEAWAGKQDSPRAVVPLHDNFAERIFAGGDEPFWAELASQLEGTRSAEQLRGMFRALGGERLFECYYSDPDRAARLTKLLDDTKLELLQKAGAVSVAAWTSDGAAETVGRCLAEMEHAGVPSPPKRLANLNQFVAEAWLRGLAQIRLRHAVSLGDEDAWNVVPCTFKDPWAGAYNSGLVDTATALIAEVPSTLQDFPEYLLVMLCDKPEAVEPVIVALLTALTENGLSWQQLPERFRSWAVQQLESNAHAGLVRDTLARQSRKADKPGSLPDEILATLIPAVLRSFESEPEATAGESMEDLIQELTGNLGGESPLTAAEESETGRTTGELTTEAPDWTRLFKFDPTSPTAHRLLPTRLTKTVIRWFAEQIHDRWRPPGSKRVSLQAAIADIALWHPEVLRVGPRILTFALAPLFEAPGIRPSAFAAVLANDAVLQNLKTVANCCLDAGSLVHPGILAASSETAEELARHIERVLQNRSDEAAHSLVATALTLWCKNRGAPEDLPALLRGTEQVLAAGASPQALQELGLLEAYLGLVARGLVDAEEIRKRSREVCEVLRVPEADGVVLSTLVQWSAQEPSQEAMSSLWSVLEDEVGSGRFDPNADEVRALLLPAFTSAAGRCERADQIIDKTAKLTTDFALSPKDAWAYVQRAVSHWQETSPPPEEVSILLKGLHDVLGPEAGPAETGELRPRYDILAAIKDFWTRLKVAAERGLSWEVLPGSPDEELRDLLEACSLDEVLENTSSMEPGEIRTRVVSEFCRTAPPELYEALCARHAYSQEEALQEWCDQFLRTKFEMLQRSLEAEPDPAEPALPGLAAACNVLEALTWNAAPSSVGPELCGVVAPKLRAALAELSPEEAAAQPNIAARAADLMLLVWSQNWAAADSEEEAAPWASAWRDGLGEILLEVFEDYRWSDDPECKRRVFTCEIISALLSSEGSAESALASALYNYRSEVPEMGFGAPIYVNDAEATLGSMFRNYRVSILRRVIDGHTGLKLDDASRKLLDVIFDKILAEVKSSCTVSTAGPDPFRASIFLPGDRYRPGGGTVEISVERGCGLVEEIAVVLLLRGLGTEDVLRPDALESLLNEILCLDLDLNNAAVGAVLRALVDHALSDLAPNGRHGIIEHLMGLRWRTGFGARADERLAALQTNDLGEAGIPAEERGPATWALCARVARAAYEAFEQPFSQNRADGLGRLMLECQDWLRDLQGGVEALLFRRVALRTGLEAVAWTSDTNDFSPYRPCALEANQNPYLTPEDFKGHLNSILGPSRGVKEGWTYLLWRGYNDNYDPAAGEPRSAKISETSNFGTTLLVKVRDHKWRPRLIKYQVQPPGAETRELSIAKLHAYRRYVEEILPHTRVAQHLLHVDTVMPLHLFGLPASDMPSRTSGYVELGTGEPIPEVSSWQMPSTVLESLRGRSLVELFCELTDSASRNSRELIQSYWPDPAIRKTLTSEEAFGRILRWCEYFWAMYRSRLLDVARQLDRLLDAMALGRLVSLDFKPQHVFLCGEGSETIPVLIDVDALYLPGSEITILNRAVEQSPYREPQYSRFLAATRKFGRMGPLQRPSEQLPFRFTPMANYFVANLILYEFLSMTPGLQAAPVDVPEFVSRQKGEVMDDILHEISEHAGRGMLDERGVPHAIMNVAERVLGDWPDFPPGADPREVLKGIGFDADCIDIDEQLAWVNRLVANAVDPPPKGSLSHPPWVYAIIPLSWLSGLDDLSELRGYDVLHVVLRLFAEGISDIDPQLVLERALTVPGRTDHEVLERFHRRCSRFYVSLGEGGREFWRRSRGKMLEQNLAGGTGGAEALLSSDVIVTFGLSERTSRRRLPRQEAVVCNFALRFAPVRDLREAFEQNALTWSPRSDEPLTVHLEHGDAASGRPPCWDAIAGVLEESADLERILHQANLETFLADPALSDFALGTDPEAVALGRPRHPKTLTRRQLSEGWKQDLDLTPYLPGAEGGPVYVRVQTTPFVFNVTWEPEDTTRSH